MKNLIIILVLFVTFPFLALSQAISGDLNINRPDPNALAFKPGEILVKLKDDVQVANKTIQGIYRTGVTSIDQLNSKYQVATMKKVFRGTQKMDATKSITMPSGAQKQLAQVFNIYKLVFPITTDVKQLVEEYKTLPEVEYAEPNYSYSMAGDIPTSEPFSMPPGSVGPKSSNVVTPNDPLYAQQWAIPAIKADSLWSYTTGDTTQVIGILDTGVDWQHPDLVNKIWRNSNEIPGNGIDDDNNGFIDDVRGWDFVNDDNNPMDDNSHGTHCAGIAAAEANNGIGIAGVSWGAKIMPVKVLQSGGSSYADQIAEGIWYAAHNGATIFSNSWGGYGESITVRLALEYAYSKGPIVAAAGNSGYKVDWPCPPMPITAPMFPACYNWVLGVEATEPSGNNAWFSNFDPTGPVLTDNRPYNGIYWNDEEYNYETRAPGVSIISTVPNGQYRYFQGTSMACPLVSGSIALMKSYNPLLSNEEVFAKLIQLNKINMFQAGVLNILKSTLNDPPPDIYYQSYAVTDSLGDRDGRADAGETIGLNIKIKNAGGLVNPVWAKIRLTEFEDTSTVHFIADSCSFGSLGTYATRTSILPMTMTLNPNLADGRNISMQVLLIYKVNNINDTVFKNIIITVEHGQEIHGFYSYLHLRANYYYLVTGPSAIDTLLIDPGVTLRFKSNMYLLANSKLTAIGKPDSMITFTGAEGVGYSGITMAPGCTDNFTYCIFEDGWNNVVNYLTNPSKIHHCIFRHHPSTILFSTKTGGDYRYNVFVDNNYNFSGGHTIIEYWNLCDFKYNIISENSSGGPWEKGIFSFYGSPNPATATSKTKFNVFMNNTKNSYSFDLGLETWNGLPMGIYYIDSNYWGTTVQGDIRKHILDYFEDPILPILEPRNNLAKPPSECHGVVWKVLINGQNPQDVSSDIVVSGRVRFDVYFNRAMDISIAPFVTFGVRFPYTQNIISDFASWSADSTIWTGYYNATLLTGDGENIVRVAFAKDPDHFEIPIENMRFRFVVQVASSQSIEFTATPGIGKVYLEWHKDDSLNTLGYNIYRYRKLTDSTYTDTLRINSGLLIDTTYFDYAVTPGLTYHYLYTIEGTDLSESDYSKDVMATPLAAANGDANGDMQVNVLDITTVISYMLNQNPQPFMFDAADVNADHTINILDVIGIVNLINGKKKAGNIFTGTNPDPAYIYLDTTSITFQSKGQVAALQFEFAGKNLEEIELLCKMQGYEFAHGMVKGKLMGIIFNNQNRPIPEGMIELVDILNCNLKLNWGDVIAGDPEGNKVNVIKGAKGMIVSSGSDLQVFPNPFSSLIKINYTLKEQTNLKLSIYDLNGKLMKTLEDQQKPAGIYSKEWNGKSDDNVSLPAGIYLLRMSGRSVTGNTIKSEIKLILNK